MEWILMPLKRYADFSGRSRRKEYWMFALLQLIIVIGLGGVVAAVAASMGAQDTSSALMTSVLFLILIVMLALIVPSIAVTVRRFHDQNKSGWFYLLALIPYAGGLILLIFMLFEGTRGSNRFGPDPKES